MALAVIGLAGLWVSERRTVTGAAMPETRLQHVLSPLGGKSSLALRIRVRLAAEADYRHGTYAATMAMLDEVRAAEDPVALAEALSLAHHCLLGRARCSARQAIDRNQLSAPLTRDESSESVAPRGMFEELTARVWSEVLAKERVSADDNFFALGGHSLVALRVVARLKKELGLAVPTRNVYQHPKLRDLARYVEARYVEARHSGGAAR